MNSTQFPASTPRLRSNVCVLRNRFAQTHRLSSFGKVSVGGEWASASSSQRFCCERLRTPHRFIWCFAALATLLSERLLTLCSTVVLLLWLVNVFWLCFYSQSFWLKNASGFFHFECTLDFTLFRLCKQILFTNCSFSMNRLFLIATSFQLEKIKEF